MSYITDMLAAIDADATLSGLVGSRVFADVADHSTATPYLVYQVVTTSGETLHNGSRDIEFPLVQISCWADTKAQAIALADAAVDALEGGVLAGSSATSMLFADRQGTYDNSSNLFAEILEFRAACNRN